MEKFVKPGVTQRSNYRYFLPVSTRWMDNDAYGHVNNVVYYSWFDTAVNQFLIEHDALDIESSPVIGLVVETGCTYFSPIAFPERIVVGIRVATLGNSSVRYEVGVFREDEEAALAQGHFVHIYVGRETRRPVTIPDTIRAVLQAIQV